MKTISARDQAHLDTGNLTTATLWKITRRDSQVFCFTDHDKDIVFGGLTYDASTSYNRTATADQASFAVSNMVVESILDSDLIVESGILAGLWDYALLEMRTVNWYDRRVLHISNVSQSGPGVVTTREAHELATGDSVTISGVGGMTELNGNAYTVTVLTSTTFSIGVNTGSYGAYLNLGEVRLAETSWNYRKCRIGQVNTSGQMFSAELLGLMKNLEKPLVRPILPGCPATLGDTECAKSLVAFTVTGTIASIDATGLQITDASRTEASGYFDYGVVTMTSGDSSGYSMEVKSSVVGSFIMQQVMPFGIAAGDTYSLVAGCDKSFATCGTKFDNVINFQGFPHLPGQDRLLRYGK